MADGAPVDVARQQRDEGGEIVGVELLGRRELPAGSARASLRSMTPLPKKRSMEGAASPSTRRLVAKRGAFSEKTKSSGVSSCQRTKLSRLIVP